MRTFKMILAVILAVILIFSLCFGLTWLGIEWRGFFGPKRAAVEREIYQETPSYVHGKKQDLVRYRLQYLSAKDEISKRAIASTVRLQFAEFDVEKHCSPEIIEFWRTCNGM